MRRIVLMALLCGVGLMACGVVGRFDPKFLIPSERKLKVTEAAEAYATSLRWGQVEEAAVWVHTDWREAFLARLSNPRAPLRFTQFELSTVELEPDRDRERERAINDLYRQPSNKDSNIIELQL